jgi:hypothetical protein
MRWTRQRRRETASQGESLVSDQPARRTNDALPGEAFLAKAGSCVRQNRVVPTPVAGAKLSVVKSVQPDRSAIKPAATVTRRIRRRGEHGISRKTIAQGMPDCFR